VPSAGQITDRGPIRPAEIHRRIEAYLFFCRLLTTGLFFYVVLKQSNCWACRVEASAMKLAGPQMKLSNIRRRPLALAGVVAVALLFALLSSAQCTRSVRTFSDAGSGFIFAFQPALTRHAVKEVSPPKPDLSGARALWVDAPPDNRGVRAFVPLDVPAAWTWPEAGRIWQRRIRPPPANDPHSL
jgi:hypothetical protein